MELELNRCTSCSQVFLGVECPYCHKLNIESSQLANIEIPEPNRLKSKIDAVNYVLSGGVVQGSSSLIVGSPGCGKSTLMLQLAADFSQNLSILYLSLEEDVTSIKARANRLALGLDNMIISSSFELNSVLELISNSNCDVVIIDSLQMINVEGRAPFSANSARAALSALLSNFSDKTFLIISCMNKSGKVAGSRMLEHMVDVVVFIENSMQDRRIITTSKNRFGKAGIQANILMTQEGFV